MTPNIKPNAPYPELATRLFTLRKQKNLTRAQLAELCGIHSRTIVNYEEGTRKPKSKIAVALAEALGVTPEELLGTDNPEKTSAALKQADTVEMFREMYGGSTARRMEAIIEATASLNAEGVLTKDEVDDFQEELTKVLIRMRENARERFTPRSKRTEAQKRSIASGRAVADAIDARIRENHSQEERIRAFNPFLLDDDDDDDDGDDGDLDDGE